MQFKEIFTNSAKLFDVRHEFMRRFIILLRRFIILLIRYMYAVVCKMQALPCTLQTPTYKHTRNTAHLYSHSIRSKQKKSEAT